MVSPPDILLCFLCQGRMFVKERNRFNQHMNNEHGVIFELDFLFLACKLDVSQRELLKTMMAGGNLGKDAHQEKVRQQLSKIIPSLGLKTSIPPLTPNNPSSTRTFTRNCPTCNKEFHIDSQNENSKTLFLVHSQNCSLPRGGGPVPGIAAPDPEEEEDIEFVTAVTADEKRGKRQSEEEDVKTVSKKSKQDDGEPETVATPPAPPVTNGPSSLLSDSDVSVKAKGTSKDVVSDANNSEKGTNSETLQTKPTTATAPNPDLLQKKSKLVCNVCKKTYRNYQGLSIHKSRMHKNEPPSESDSSQPEVAEPETQSPISKDNLVCCGKKFQRLYNLRRHQKENCGISKSSPKTSVVNSIPVNETLIDKEATVEELLAPDEGDENENSELSDDEINRRLFMDNVAGGSDEEEDDDDDLEIIDFVAGSTHRLSNESVKSEPVESESESKMKLILQSKYYQENSRMFEICAADNLATYEKEFKGLKGWKVKVNQIKKANGTVVPATHFLSPEGITVRSGVAVLEYLRLGGWGEAEITAQARRMKVKESNLKVYQEKYFGAATA